MRGWCAAARVLRCAVLPSACPGEKILNFGKHKARTFAAVLADYPEYCDWAAKQPDDPTMARTNMSEFREYIAAHRRPAGGTKAVYDSPRGAARTANVLATRTSAPAVLRSRSASPQQKILDRVHHKHHPIPSMSAATSKSYTEADPSYGERPANPLLAAAFDFCVNEGCDPQSTEMLQNSAPEVIGVVMFRGTLVGENKSALLTSRVRETERRFGRETTRALPRPLPPIDPPQLLPRSQTSGYSMAEQVDMFVEKNAVDDTAAEILRNASSCVQMRVLERGDIEGGSNCSAVLVSRVRKAEREEYEGIVR